MSIQIGCWWSFTSSDENKLHNQLSYWNYCVLKFLFDLGNGFKINIRVLKIVHFTLVNRHAVQELSIPYRSGQFLVRSDAPKYQWYQTNNSYQNEWRSQSHDIGSSKAFLCLTSFGRKKNHTPLTCFPAPESSASSTAEIILISVNEFPLRSFSCCVHPKLFNLILHWKPVLNISIPTTTQAHHMAIQKNPHQQHRHGSVATIPIPSPSVDTVGYIDGWNRT